jgi:hypothetical protein
MTMTTILTALIGAGLVALVIALKITGVIGWTAFAWILAGLSAVAIVILLCALALMKFATRLKEWDW